jgi:hypothetical protein
LLDVGNTHLFRCRFKPNVDPGSEDFIEAPGILKSLTASIPTAESVKNKFDPARDSKLFEYPIEIVPYRMLLNLKPLSDFAVLHAVGDEANHIFLAARQ